MSLDTGCAPALRSNPLNLIEFVLAKGCLILLTQQTSPLLPASALLEALRTEQPLTQCITNSVVTNFTANVLLALGAKPAMVDIVGEAGIFASIASGLLINVGTPNPEQREAAREAAAATTKWVLDPVAVGALPVRTQLARELLGNRPAIIRGNASEILGLAGVSAGGRGVDSTDETESALEAALGLAKTYGSVVAISGPVDIITDGLRVARVTGGHSVMTLVTGVGCSLGAVMAALLGVADAFSAAVAASVIYSAAAEVAVEQGHAPGSFAVNFIDALSSIKPEGLGFDSRVTLA